MGEKLWHKTVNGLYFSLDMEWKRERGRGREMRACSKSCEIT